MTRAEWAALGREQEATAALLGLPHSLDAPNWMGMTALCTAAKCGNVRGLQLLLQVRGSVAAVHLHG